ncbi:hypothetical protein [Serratia marcescens]|uniref:hypothetical protein n=1 Tax=Serratia marcescens TaxID=615 RepID=UPI0009A48001|nr:hypothetical protein [Serratia marcescens]OPJ96497.1 hypothetical protein B1R44_10935 [Serratia marcescens]
MDNKLSELSKPVATVDVQRGRMDGNTFAVAWSSAGHALPDGPHFIYAQEYVSALTQRIAELEAIRSDASQVFKEIGNELGCNPDNESIMMAIDALKERLATPVRLPTKYSMLHREDFHSDYQSKMVFKADEVIAALHAHGLTVEGDE